MDTITSLSTSFRSKFSISFFASIIVVATVLLASPIHAFAYVYDTATWGTGSGNVGYGQAWHDHSGGLLGIDSSNIPLGLFNPVVTYNISEIDLAMIYGGIDNATEKNTGDIVLKIYSGDGTTSTLGTLLYTSNDLDLSTLGNTTAQGMGGVGEPYSGQTLIQNPLYDFTFPSTVTLSSGSNYIFVLAKGTTSVIDATTNAYCSSNDCSAIAQWSFLSIPNSGETWTSENSSIIFNTGNPQMDTMPMRFVGSSGSPPVDTSTHIASTTPADLQNTATSTNYYFGVNGVINSADIGSNMNVTLQYYNDTLAQTVASPSVVSHYITFPLIASTTSSFSFSTTTDMSSAPLGRYYLKTTINKDEFSFFGLFSFWSTAITTKVTTFYVSTTTAHIYVTGYDAVADTSNPANITAIEAGITTCDFSWGDLASTSKISSFLTCLVVPDSSSLAITFNQFQQNVLTLAPWGYITRFVNILASTTPVEPPPLTYKFGSSSPPVLQAYTASDPITFQVFDYMGSSSPLLEIRADDGSNKNVWDIIDPFVSFLVTVGVLLVILGDIMGFSMPTGESENERMKKIDYSKMSDREFKKRVKIEYLTEDEQRMQRRNRL